MPLYDDPYEVFQPLAEIIALCLLVAGLALSLGVAIVLAATASQEESLIVLIFWPLLSAGMFGLALCVGLYTYPTRKV